MGEISAQNRHGLVFMHHWHYLFIASPEGQEDDCGLLTVQRPDTAQVVTAGEELVLDPWEGSLGEGKSVRAQAGSMVFIRDVPV